MGNSYSYSDYLRAIDNETDRTAIIKTIQPLFDLYDQDKSGTLSGFELTRVIESIGQYLYNTKLSEHDKRRYHLGHIYYWVNKTLDVNSDGRITKQEFASKIKQLLENPKKDL